MKAVLPTLIVACVAHCAPTTPSQTANAEASEKKLEMVAEFGDQQATGVAAAKNGRIFVNFPRWSDKVRYSVAEVVSGKVTPFPDEVRNTWEPASAADRFVCVQSVVVDSADHLWILDPASPMFQGVVPGAAKMVEVDLATNTVVRTIRFGADVAPVKSYLNDVRFDRERRFGYLTDSGLGAIVVVDLANGTQRRVLAEHASTKAEKDPVSVAGQTLVVANGDRPQVHSDGIALDPTGTWLYWHALTGRSLYRAKTADLRDASLTPQALGARVELVARTHPPDGMEMDASGQLFLTDIEDSAVVRLDPRAPSAPPQVVARGPQLDWPDSLAFSPDGNDLYITASQIEHAPRFNQGVDRRTEPYRLWRLPLK
ncbi:major royal jelly family protein [Pendulispora rubella]|uniref:Major royal jelly family protein n=1 Tax=Pendulispora rubella TaxID=2741070 RepID=A0ABZ2L0D1_9BACT